MGHTRDIIQEIADVRERRQFDSAMEELPERLFALEKSFKTFDKNDSELIRHFPVALIALVESYFRMAIKDLVDAGEPYLTNAEKLTSLKLDFSVLRAVYGKTITVGELVAHGMQLSRLEHVETHLSNLLGVGFLDSLRMTTDRWAHEVLGKPAIPILSKPDEVFADVDRAFELRHIICHEIASAYEIKSDEVARCFENCVAFLKAADEFISEATHPGEPLTQAGMNIAAGRSLSEKRRQLAKAVKALRARLDETELAAFNKSQLEWQRYCDAWASFVAGYQVEGGTMWPLIYYDAAESLVGQRIDEVNNAAEFEF